MLLWWNFTTSQRRERDRDDANPANEERRKRERETYIERRARQCVRGGAIGRRGELGEPQKQREREREGERERERGGEREITSGGDAMKEPSSGVEPRGRFTRTQPIYLLYVSIARSSSKRSWRICHFFSYCDG